MTLDTNVCKHSVVQTFKTRLNTAAMCVSFDIVREAAQMPNKVETGTIAHFDCTVCNDDDHFISPFSTRSGLFCPKSGAV